MRNQLTQASLYGVTASQSRPFFDQFKNHHLEIEAPLEDLIQSRFRDPTAYNCDRLRFPAKIELAKALVGPQPDDHLWNVVSEFNRVRNAMVHFKNLPEVNSRLTELRAAVKAALPVLNWPDDQFMMIEALKIALWFVRDIKQSLPPP